MKFVKKTVKVLFWLFAVVVLLMGGTMATFGIAYYKLDKLRSPESVDMASMHHAEEKGHRAVAVNQFPVEAAACTELKENPSNASIQRFELTAAATKLKLDNGSEIDAWTFNGTSPGPELRVKEGDRVVVKLTNTDISSGVTIHWHGVVLPCSQDGVAGVTQDAVMPGQTFTYEFVAKHRGTYWYHSHQMSSEQSGRGLIGRFIVEPKENRAQIVRDYAVTLQRLEAKESIRLVNGRTGLSKLDADPGETVRLRFINSENKTRNLSVDGTAFRVVSLDGQDLNEPGLLEGVKLPVGAGQRYDIVFTMPPQGNVGIIAEDKDGKEGRKPIVSVGKDDADTIGFSLEGKSKLPEFDFSSYGAPLTSSIPANADFQRTYDLKLNSRLFAIFTINGKSFHEIPPLLVKKDELVKITISNEGGGDHPFHIHGHTFQVLTRNGNALTGSPVYLDTLLLHHGEAYDIAIKADNPGLWMMHCHNLIHARNGMTMMLNYEGVGTPHRVGTVSGNLPD
jgi:FtsP/CotA-like multicopper oxidase with cupredoxin domain